MQEIFEHFSILIVNGDERALKMLDELVKIKLQNAIENQEEKPFKNRILKRMNLSSTDPDVIYDLLDKHDPIKR